MSWVYGTNVECIYASTAVGIAKASFTTEIGINDVATMGPQAYLPSGFWGPGPNQEGKAVHITARGILSSTATPTYTFSLRLGGIASITGPIVLGSAALITTTTVTNAPWELEGDIVLTNVGVAAAAATVRGIGRIICPGLAAVAPPAGIYQPLWGGAASPGTVATVDLTATNYINFNVACSASNAANTITLQQLLVFGLN